MAAVAILYLPVYLALRKKFCFLRQMSFLLLIGCCLIILLATVLISVFLGMTEGLDSMAVRHDINMIPLRWTAEEWAMGREEMLTQVAANVVMFIPFGFILPAALPVFPEIFQDDALRCVFLFSDRICTVFYRPFFGYRRFSAEYHRRCHWVSDFLLFSKLFQTSRIWRKFTGRPL